MEKRKLSLRKLGKNRYLLLIGDVEEGIYTYGMLLKNKVIQGRELYEEEVETLYQGFILPTAKDRVLRLLARRERSRGEIVDYLKRKRYSHRVINTVLQDFTNSKLIDDRRFAEIFVKTRSDTNPRGRRFIEYELKNKGISEEVIQEVLSEYDEEDVLRSLVEKVRRKYRDKEEKLIKYLLNRGFDYYLIQKVLHED